MSAEVDDVAEVELPAVDAAPFELQVDAETPDPEPSSPAQPGVQGEAEAAALDALAAQIERFHDRSEHQEEIIRAMQERIVALQGDQILSLLRPALERIAVLHARAAEAASSAQERGERAANDLAFFATAVEDAFAMLDLSSVGAVEGMAFDSSSHAAAEAVVTGDEEQHLIIARVMRQGFTYPGARRATIPAQVTVYRFDEGLKACTAELGPDKSCVDADPAEPYDGTGSTHEPEEN